MLGAKKLGDDEMMELNLVVGRHYKLILNNGFTYKGRFLGRKDRKIDFYDWKIKDSVAIDSESVFVVEPVNDGDLRDFNR